MNRIGDCNRCGSCCNSEEGFPFPKNFPDSIRNWQFSDIQIAIPHYGILGLEGQPDGSLQIVTYYGNHNIQGNKIYWRWIYRKGLCKNLEPYEDEETYVQECPWLLDDDGTGRRECALVGTRYEEYWETICWSAIDNQGNPGMAPEVFTEEEAIAWKTAHPDCGYDWE
jgi:hypothetical protein